MLRKSSAWLSVLGGVIMLPQNLPAAEPAANVLRAGIIGLDTSHVTAFTSEINRADAEGDLARLQVVAAWPGGSPDVESSHTRVAGFTEELRKQGVEIVESIDTLLSKVDVVLLESVDGRPHLAQVRPVFAAKKPVFIDKPLAGSLADGLEIFRLARESGVPCFSSSSLRFSPGILGMRRDERVGDVLGCAVHSPCSLEPHHPDLFWYGVHGVEMLFTIMGTGCESVSRTHTDGTDLAVGVWKDGRIGTYRGLRNGAHDYGAVVYGSKGIAPSGSYAGYQPLVAEIAKFFITGTSPVPAEETIEIFAFMEAADESKRQGGRPVTLASVLQKAREQSAARASSSDTR